MTLKCVACLSGRNWECIHHGRCNEELVNSFGLFGSGSGGSADNTHSLEEASTEGTGRLREADDVGESSGKRLPVRQIETYKDDANLKDQQSTGRKRAAEMYPLDREAPCDWRGQTNCGGNKPIVGCVNGKQEARHHGPDKNTLNNDAGNVHCICHNCHNRWHATNDDSYVWNSLYPPHDPKTATFEELMASELKWKGIKLKKAVD